jgi:riboflavin kinase/FMN adenylyltransferase
MSVQQNTHRDSLAPQMAAGDVADVRVIVSGVVIHGDKRGRGLGFPTANIAVADVGLSPADGVYAAYVRTASGDRYGAAVSVGRRPTFAATEVVRDVRLVEAHLLGFEGDLYGGHLVVELVAELRPQQRFSGVEALTAQLRRDISRAGDVLSTVAPAHV